MFELHNKAHKNYYFLNPLLTQATMPVIFSLNFQPIKTPDKKSIPKIITNKTVKKINLNILSPYSFLLKYFKFVILSRVLPPIKIAVFII